ncbi:MAG: SCO family protein [Pseudomonadota bacterium]|nr:SCO family protein [Sphingomonas sp.]MDQ3478511.1 SCO family protein [Pseudomonadota bacterium]
MRRIRVLIWILVALALIGTGVLLVYPRTPTQPTATITSTSFGGPFTLVGTDGQPFASSRLSGKPYAIFFGFTHCPDVCPTALARLAQLRKQLGRGEDAFNIVFVSVDPERDGPKEVASYATAFGSPVIALTGSPAQIDKVKKRYAIFSEKVPQGDTYTVDHSAAVLLFDRNGGFKATISAEEQDGPALDKLRQLTA